MVVALTLHLLAAAFWVGGMFFAYVFLRPAASALEPELRLQLWRAVLARFLPSVALAILLLLVTGYWMVFSFHGGFAALSPALHLMQLVGWVMVGVYAGLVASPWRRFVRALAAADLAAAAHALARIRRLVAINTALGIVNLVLGAVGRFTG